MRERIGTTRSKKPIELIWSFDNGIRIIKSFSRFALPNDQFDLYAVCDSRAFRFRQSKDGVSEYEAAALISVAEIIRESLGEENIDRISDQLGIRNSLDRYGYGLSLGYPSLRGHKM